MDYEIEIREVGPQPVLAVKGDQVPSDGIAGFMGESYASIARRAAALGITPSGAPMARYQAIAGERFDVEALVPFSQPAEGEGEVYASTLRPGRAATCEHVGPYDRLGLAYAALGGWLTERGLRSEGGSWEEYLTEPGAVPPAECRTRLYIPITDS